MRERFLSALFAMSYENPAHRPILEAEGLKEWVAADVTGYTSLQQACTEQGLFRRSAAAV
jgi:hypothetical protein